MPPRFAYWTIIAGGLPTSFRAADKDELMPTFRRLKEKHPDAVMKYFARGQLWDSPEEARLALRRGQMEGSRRRTAGAARETRGRDWRPGGEHRDPRQRFKDAQKTRNQDQRRQRWQRKHGTRVASEPRVKPHGDPLATRVARRPFSGERGFTRNQDKPPRPPGPDREPPPGREPKPEPPPRPSEPTIKPPGPPERGRASTVDGGVRKRRGKE